MIMKRTIFVMLLVVLVLALAACGKEAETVQSPEPQEVQPAVQEETVQEPAVEEQTPLERAAAYLISAVQDPTVGSTFGDWAVLGLARSGVDVPEGYFETYYKNVETYVRDCQGVLDTRKYSEYSRVILALTAIGKVPNDVAGYDLTAPLGDYDQTVFQGINGPAFALLALDSANYEMPVCPEGKTQAIREDYVLLLLEKELEGGGWSFAGGTMDADMTAMVLQALAKYQDAEPVAEAVERGINALSAVQNANGGFSVGGEENSEVVSQVIVALGELGIPLDDPRFVKDGKGLMDALISYQNGDGGFSHLPGGKTDQMATEQAFYAMVAAQRLADGKSALYDMNDVE